MENEPIGSPELVKKASAASGTVLEVAAANNEESAQNVNDIKKQMLQEQREMNKSVTGHDFGNS